MSFFKKHWGKRVKFGAFCLLLGVSFGAYFVFELGSLLSLESLQQNQTLLQNRVEQHYWASVFLFISFYVLVVAFSLPGATLLTLAAGVIFGLGGSVYVVLAATLGAVLAALITRFFLREALEAKFAKQLTKFNAELEKGKVGYLFSLRLLPIFPFFLINNLAGLSRLDMATFAWTTALGIVPGTLAYTNAGEQISELETLGDVLSVELILAFSILGLLAFVPNLLKKYLEKNQKTSGENRR